jgi:hypothetical protein
MQDVDLFLSLAEIAGVFVGFGALIAVRSRDANDAREVAPLRAVVMTGMMTIIAALAPVTLDRYDLTDHQTWALSSGLVLVTYAGLAFIHIRAPEYQAAAADLMATRSTIQNILEDAAYLAMFGGSALALIAIMLGLAAAELEAALYFTVVVLVLLQAAWTLLWLVFRQRRRATA